MLAAVLKPQYLNSATRIADRITHALTRDVFVRRTTVIVECLIINQASETACEGLQHDKGLPPDVHDSHSTGEPSLLRGTRREKK